MSTQEKRPRPAPGTTTTREIRTTICGACGCVIQDGGMCDYECPYDGAGLNGRPHVVAVYERTDKFLRDEPPQPDEA